MSFFIIGVLTLLYCFLEIVVALRFKQNLLFFKRDSVLICFLKLRLNSLTLLSDGFHNFSDVLALCIAYYAAQVFKLNYFQEIFCCRK